jgi:hypothetical protein
MPCVRATYTHTHAHTHAPTTDLVTPYNYPFQVRHVTTADGYRLTMHRIPHGSDEWAAQRSSPGGGSWPTRPAVLLQHGLLQSAADFLVLGPGKVGPRLAGGLGGRAGEGGK